MTGSSFEEWLERWGATLRALGLTEDHLREIWERGDYAEGFGTAPKPTDEEVDAWGRNFEAKAQTEPTVTPEELALMPVLGTVH
jgi:hypothetical protein